jgi:hypothetical protein
VPASSKSEFVTCPRGFEKLTSCCWMCSGNGSLQTNGFPVRGNQTPPAPLFAASQAPMWTGSPGINSSRCVGRLASHRRSPKVLRADRIGPVICMQAWWAACWATWSRENWPSLPGMPGVRLQSWPMRLCQLFNPTRFRRLVSAMAFSVFSRRCGATSRFLDQTA